MLRMGNENVADVVCVGQGVTDFEAHQNRIGIYFDPGFTTVEHHTSVAPEIVTGYLVFHEPSVPSGVGAWECSYDLEGQGMFLGWQLEGQAINVGRYNNLVVGIGGDPLPWAESVLLATFNLLVDHPAAEAELSLGPANPSSLADHMAWAPGGQPGTLLPMLTVHDMPVVAVINKFVSGAPPALPVATRLLPNVPNPFNPSTRIDFELSAPSRVRLAIYDVTGREVAVLADGSFPAGLVSRTWNGRDRDGRGVPSGPYFVRMVTDTGQFTRKTMLLK
jgi:hypothetical protein